MRSIRLGVVLIVCGLVTASACTRSSSDLSAAKTTSSAKSPISVPVDDDVSPTVAPPAPEATTAVEVNGEEQSLGWPLDLDAPAPPVDPQRLPISPDVRTGLLDNGLVYYVRSHAEPADALSLRLVVNAGSLQQEVPESGLAHFVEHMLFNGTESFPGNELDAVLQRLGAELGPDLNAYTSADETVYMLDLQNDDPELYDVAFTVLREWSSKALFDPVEVEAERGVVREETRSYYTSGTAELDTAFDDAYDAGTAYMARFPGGRGDEVMNITADQARGFYERWYRPDNMAVIVVGDYPVEELEATIVERFGDLPAPSEPLPELPERGSGWNDQPIVETITSPTHARTEVSIDWPVPANPLATVGDLQQLLREQLLVTVLDERLARLSDTPGLGLVDARGSSFDWNRRRAILGLNAGTDDLLNATTLILSEFGAVAEGGVSDAEFERAAESMRASIQHGLDQRVTNGQLADGYVRSFLTGAADIYDPDFAEEVLRLLDEVQPQDITDYWRYVASNTAPIVILISEDEAHAVNRDDAARAVAAASSDQATATDDVPDITSVVTAPPRQEPAETFSVDSVDQTAHAWSYDNGATVVFVESTIEEQTFSVIGQQRGGTSQLDDAKAPLAALAVDAVDRSGLGDNSHASIARFARDAQVQTQALVSTYAQSFVANGVASGLAPALELIYAQMTAPEIDEVGLSTASRVFRDELRFRASDPATHTEDEVARLRFGDQSSRRVTPSVEAVDSARAEDLLSIYKTLFGGVDETMIFIVVGDLAVDDVRAATDVYIANLPTQAGVIPSDLDDEPLEEVRSSTITFGEPESSGELVEYFSTATSIADADLVAAEVAAGILDQRLFDVIREEMAATYGGLVDVIPAPGPASDFETTISFAGDPARLDEIRDRLVNEIAQLVENGPSDDELQRVRAILQADWAYLSNADLYEQALRAIEGDDALRWGDVGVGSVPALRKLELLDAVSASDVQAIAASLWPVERRIEVLRVPTGS